MKKQIARGVVAVTLLTFTVTGCAGRAANPITEYQYGDDKKSCNHVKVELAQINNDITLKRQAQDNVNVGNVFLFVGGLFIWPLWFAMNFKSADGIEADALQRRHNALVRYAADKECGLEIQEIKTEEPTEEIEIGI